MIYDQFGRQITEAPKKPLTEMIGPVRVRDQWTTYPSVKLTPEKLAGIFKEADVGEVVRQAELFEEMEEKDPILGSVLQTRRLAVQALEINISPSTTDAEGQKIADALKENFEDLDLEDCLLDLLDAIGKGFGTVEINWQMEASKAWISGFEWIHQKRWTFVDYSANWNAPLPKLPRLLTDKEPIRGEDVPPFKVVYHRYKARSGFAPRAGLLRPVAYYYLFKNYDIKDWIIFLEKFGQPLRLGKFTPGASPEDKEILRQAIRDLGADAGAMISDTTILDIIESKTTQASGDLYERAAKFFDRNYEIAVLGQTATTEGTPGKLGNEQAQAEVRRDLTKADARALAKTLRWQVAWPWVGFNFGWDKPVPNIKFLIEDPEDLEALSRTHKNLVEMGAPVPVSFVQKKYGIPAPEGNEPILQAPAVPQPGGFGAIADKKKVPIGRRLVKISD
jgi:phage gp29-like protein